MVRIRVLRFDECIYIYLRVLIELKRYRVNGLGGGVCGRQMTGNSCTFVCLAWLWC